MKEKDKGPNEVDEGKGKANDEMPAILQPSPEAVLAHKDGTENFYSDVDVVIACMMASLLRASLVQIGKDEKYISRIEKDKDVQLVIDAISNRVRGYVHLAVAAAEASFGVFDGANWNDMLVLAEDCLDKNGLYRFFFDDVMNKQVDGLIDSLVEVVRNRSLIVSGYKKFSERFGGMALEVAEDLEKSLRSFNNSVRVAASSVPFVMWSDNVKVKRPVLEKLNFDLFGIYTNSCSSAEAFNVFALNSFKAAGLVPMDCSFERNKAWSRELTTMFGDLSKAYDDICEAGIPLDLDEYLSAIFGNIIGLLKVYSEGFVGKDAESVYAGRGISGVGSGGCVGSGVRAGVEEDSGNDEPAGDEGENGDTNGEDGSGGEAVSWDAFTRLDVGDDRGAQVLDFSSRFKSGSKPRTNKKS